MAKASALPVCIIFSVLSFGQSWAQDDQIKLLQEIRKTCSGVIELSSKNGTGSVTFKNYQLDVQAGKDIEIHQEGVLVAKVQSYTASDYNNCIKDLSTIFAGRQGQNAPFKPSDFVSKLKFGEYGQTSIDYIKSLLGAPVSHTDRRAHFEQNKFGIDVKFLDKKTVDGPKGLIVAVKIVSTNNTQFVLNAPNLLGDRLNSKALFNKDALQDFNFDCSFDYFGGTGDNSDPVYFCASDGDHSQGFINICVYLDDSHLTGNAASDIWKYIALQNYYEKIRTENEIKAGKTPSEFADDWHYYDIPSDPAADERELGLTNRMEIEKSSVLQERIDAIAAKMRVSGIQISYETGIGNLNTIDDPGDFDVTLHVPPPKSYR